jgi:ATP-dependent Clp protease adaptor protein ClpS
MSSETKELAAPTDIDTTTQSFTLILYNDSYHTFEEVIEQVMKASGCGYDRAESITMEVHTKGRAAVITGELAKCLRAQTVLEEINLRTAIEVNG